MSLAAHIEPERAASIEIALVNNMPDQALQATVEQFSGLVDAALRGVEFRLRLYSLSGARCSATARRARAQDHEPVGALYARGANVLIVTGAEPKASDLTHEAYWEGFVELVRWARANTEGAIWSCLAAHGAALALDGVQRQAERRKISGIYAFEAAGDWLTEGAAGAIRTPHSRYNGLARRELERFGYHVSTFAPDVGVDSFWRREPSLFLFLQGHPEYDAATLLREFRRDALRYVAGDHAHFPPTPANYFSPTVECGIADLRETADRTRRMRLVGRLNALLESESPRPRWRDDAERLYRNFFAQIASGRASRDRRHTL